MVNLYELLGLPIDATENQIRQHIMQHHNAETLDEKYLKAAKGWLLNEGIRKQYDAKLEQEHPELFIKIDFNELDDIGFEQRNHRKVSNGYHQKSSSKKSNGSLFSDDSPYKYRVNKAAFCVCAFLFGALGIHWFIAGKHALGLCYLVMTLLFFTIWFLMWIVPVLALIDFIVGLTKQQDENGYIYYNNSWFG